MPMVTMPTGITLYVRPSDVADSRYMTWLRSRGRHYHLRLLLKQSREARAKEDNPQAPVAQLAERPPRKGQVVGSTPAWGSTTCPCSSVR